jgi:hypothetical protein
VSLAKEMVLALSAADIPVVTPPLRSTETVKAVSMGSVLLTMTCNPNFYSGFQLTGKSTSVSCHEVDHFELLFGCCQKSPSFSRSSSTTMIIFSLTDVFNCFFDRVILFLIMVAIYFLDGNNFEIFLNGLKITSMFINPMSFVAR